MNLRVRFWGLVFRVRVGVRVRGRGRCRFQDGIRVRVVLGFVLG